MFKRKSPSSIKWRYKKNDTIIRQQRVNKSWVWSVPFAKSSLSICPWLFDHMNIHFCPHVEIAGDEHTCRDSETQFLLVSFIFHIVIWLGFVMWCALYCWLEDVKFYDCDELFITFWQQMWICLIVTKSYNDMYWHFDTIFLMQAQDSLPLLVGHALLDY